METNYIEVQSEDVQSLIFLSKNKDKENIRFGTFCKIENRDKVSGVVMKILSEIERLFKENTNFITMEWLKKYFFKEYSQLKELTINLHDLEFSLVRNLITNDYASLVPFLVSMDCDELKKFADIPLGDEFKKMLNDMYSIRFGEC